MALKKSAKKVAAKKTAAKKKAGAKKKAAAKKAGAKKKAAATKASAKKASAKKAGARKAGARKKAGASAAKKAAAKKAAGEKVEKRSEVSSKSGISSMSVNLGHVFSLRPRVSTTFRQADFLTAKHRLVDEAYSSIEEAARAVAEKALELTRGGPIGRGGTRRGFGER